MQHTVGITYSSFVIGEFCKPLLICKLRTFIFL